MTIEYEQATKPLVGPPSRAAANERLEAWLDEVSEYQRRRNYDLPGHRGVSRLSPHLAIRLLPEELVLERLLAEYSWAAIRPFADQLLWRTYWKGWLEQHPVIWRRYCGAVESLPELLSKTQENNLKQACAGETGLDAFDHWVEELRTTSYLHNHARMWFASIWMFTLKLPWELGADFFLRHLLDGDPAVNTLSWRWVAGLHTRGKHYVARSANIERFTEGRFSLEGQLETAPEPLEESYVPELEALGPVGRANECLLPDLSESPSGLLGLSDDLSPEATFLGEAPFHSILFLGCPGIAASTGFAPQVQQFRAEALIEAGDRAVEHWSGERHAIEDLRAPQVGAGGVMQRGARTRVYAGTVDDYLGALVRWTEREHLRVVRLLEPPVGAWRDVLPEIRKALQRRGVSLRLYRREWDAAHWPFAARGYFQFRKGAEARLEALGFSLRE